MNRKEHWDAIYKGKSPLEVSWYQQEPRLSLELIAACGVEKTAPIIDVGGGTSVLVDRLLDAGYTQLSVLDISPSAIELARQRLGVRAVQVEWIEADVTAFSPPHRYQVWHDRAVFHFLTDPEDRHRYIEVLRRALPVGGQLIVAAFAIGGPVKCSGLDVVQYDADKIASELGAEFRLIEERSEMHRTPAGKDQKFGYYRFRRVC